MGFKPGAAWKGNAKGRPPVGEALAERIRRECGDDGEKLVAMLTGLAIGQHKDTQARIKAAALLLERGYGKPPDGFNLRLDGDGPKRVKFILERD